MQKQAMTMKMQEEEKQKDEPAEETEDSALNKKFQQLKQQQKQKKKKGKKQNEEDEITDQDVGGHQDEEEDAPKVQFFLPGMECLASQITDSINCCQSKLISCKTFYCIPFESFLNFIKIVKLLKNQVQFINVTHRFI